MREQWAKKVNISTNDNELFFHSPKTITDIDEICGNHLLKQLENFNKQQVTK
jgi:hypothetical protein